MGRQIGFMTCQIIQKCSPIQHVRIYARNAPDQRSRSSPDVGLHLKAWTTTAQWTGTRSLPRWCMKLITLSGNFVMMLTPSSSAVGVLKSEGFSKAETFQRFQGDKLLQSVASGEVLWVDEAGFLSSRQMHWLVQFAERERCRLILSGDALQHHGVERGDALRVLENAGVVTQARLTTIVRQQVEPLRLTVH
jgi:hypothetical protein